MGARKDKRTEVRHRPGMYPPFWMPLVGESVSARAVIGTVVSRVGIFLWRRDQTVPFLKSNLEREDFLRQ